MAREKSTIDNRKIQNHVGGFPKEMVVGNKTG